MNREIKNERHHYLMFVSSRRFSIEAQEVYRCQSLIDEWLNNASDKGFTKTGLLGRTIFVNTYMSLRQFKQLVDYILSIDLATVHLSIEQSFLVHQPEFIIAYQKSNGTVESYESSYSKQHGLWTLPLGKEGV